MRKLLCLAVLSVVLGALVFAGCGSDDKSSESTTGNGASAQSTDTGAGAQPSGGGAAAGDIIKVEMKNIEFIPDKVTAKVGQTVEWTNNDGTPHNVTAKDKGVDSGTVNPAGKFSFTTKEPGTIDYVCTIHPGQKGSIEVTS